MFQVILADCRRGKRNLCICKLTFQFHTINGQKLFDTLRQLDFSSLQFYLVIILMNGEIEKRGTSQLTHVVTNDCIADAAKFS